MSASIWNPGSPTPIVVSASLISFSPTSTISATNVQAAIEEVVTDLASVSGAASIGTSAGVTLANLLKPQAASLTDGSSNTINGTSARVFVGGTPSTDYCSFLVGQTLTGSYNSGAHAFRDESTVNFSGSGLIGYCPFDAIYNATGSSPWNHIRSYQARPEFSGSGLCDEEAGLHHQITHTGTGTITNSYAVRASDALGTGPIALQAALYVDAGGLTRGVSNFVVLSFSQSTPSYHGGSFQFGNGIIIARPASSLPALQVTANGGNFAMELTGDALNPCQISLKDSQVGGRSWGLQSGLPAAGWVALRDNTAGVNRITVDTNGAVTIIQPTGGTTPALTVNAVAGRNAITTVGPVRTTAVTVATLPLVADVGAGARHFVTDANATTFAAIVAGGGANGVPVYCDGTNWRIG